MRSYIPGTMSKAYVEALGDWQDAFLKSITASPEDAERYRKADPDWVKEGKNGNQKGK
jgi:hypothetical protein